MKQSQASWDASNILRRGAGPFVTLLKFVRHGRVLIWNARQNRKGLRRGDRGLEHTALPVWQTARYNSAVGVLFALGALLFFVGAGLSLSPGLLGVSASQIAQVFFLGSLPFTAAAYMQHFQSANAPSVAAMLAPDTPRPPLRWLGWQPRSAGWLSTVAQFAGTLAFNVNTYQGLQPPEGWLAQDWWIWTPDMAGSLLFLASGYLALLEAGHAYWSWRPKDLAWWIAFINLLGCVFFMIAALLAYVPQHAAPAWLGLAANVNLACGACGFLIGGVLLTRESRQADAGVSTT